jgi:hypothetical protein
MIFICIPPNGSDFKYKLTLINTGATVGEGAVSVTLPSSILLLAPHCQQSNGTANTAVNSIVHAISSLSCMNVS